MVTTLLRSNHKEVENEDDGKEEDEHAPASATLSLLSLCCLRIAH